MTGGDLARQRRCVQRIGERWRLPEEHLPDVLVRLGQAATRRGRMPHQDPTPAAIYQALREILVQVGRYDDAITTA